MALWLYCVARYPDIDCMLTMGINGANLAHSKYNTNMFNITLVLFIYGSFAADFHVHIIDCFLIGHLSLQMLLVTTSHITKGFTS